MPRKTTSPHVAEPALARKNMDMSVAKLDKARELLDARTDTETVDRALDYVIFQSEVFAALESLHALGGIDDPFPRRKARQRSAR